MKREKDTIKKDMHIFIYIPIFLFNIYPLYRIIYIKRNKTIKEKYSS